MIKGSGMTGFSPAYFNQGFDILSEFPVVPLNRLLLRFFFFTFYTFHLTSSILFSVGKDQDVSCSLVYGRSAGRGFKGGGQLCPWRDATRLSHLSRDVLRAQFCVGSAELRTKGISFFYIFFLCCWFCKLEINLPISKYGFGAHQKHGMDGRKEVPL